MFSRIAKEKGFCIGLVLMIFLIIIALFANFLAPYGPKQLTDDLLVAPGNQGHYFGTDSLGGDVFSNIIYGTRTSLTIGLVASLISALIGVAVGAVAGYFGGKWDRIISEFINIFVMTPAFFLILIIVAFFGSSMTNVMIVIGFTSWVGNARIMRAQAMSIKERTFVKSAYILGEKHRNILLSHIIPNAIYPIIANTIMNISGAILLEASLSFLGLGDPNVVSWGQMISQGSAYMPRSWWVSTFPGIAIVITVLSLQLIGDGINKILTPKTPKG